MTAAVVIDGLDFTWPGRDGFRLTCPSFRLERGERLLLTGASGSGKSTLLNLICGTLLPDEGVITVLGTAVNHLSGARRDQFRADRLGIVFQQFNLLPYLSAIDNVLLPLHFSTARRAAVAALASPPAQEARRLLGRLGLDADTVARRPARHLSTGQQQRVAAARALIGGPDLLVADEPTSALDHPVRGEFLALLAAEMERSGASLLLVSHDPGLAPHFDRVMPFSAVAPALPAHPGAAAVAGL